MVGPIDMTEINKLFNTPRPKVAPKPMTTEERRALYTAQIHGPCTGRPPSLDSSPSSSTATLTNDEDEHRKSFTSSKFDDNSPLSAQAHRGKRGSQFNPHATPFVPSCSFDQASTSPHAGQGSPPMGPSPPPWMRAFISGVQATTAVEQIALSSNLVGSRSWNTDSIAELAHHFVRRGSDGTQQFPRGIAPFAQLVYIRFKETLGEGCASTFLYELRQGILGIFNACWSSKNPEGTNFARRPSPVYLSSALNLATFVGDLFANNVITSSPTNMCLSLLLAELSSIEHLYALYELLSHAGKNLWSGESDLRDKFNFVTMLTQKTSCLRPNPSIMGNKVGKIQVDGWVKDIVDIVGPCSPGRSRS